MSVSGLYDSIAGDRLADKTLAPFRHLDDTNFDDEEPRRGGRPRRKCACGNELARPYIRRGGINVCAQCAARIPQQRGGRVVVYQCEGCGQVLPRRLLTMWSRKLYCKVCADKL